jgi:hypothetical protein
VQATPSSQAVAVPSGVQVPMELGSETSLQDWQPPVQAALQHTPCEQTPVRHCPAFVQPAACASLGTHALPEQYASAEAHRAESKFEHVVKQACVDAASQASPFEHWASEEQHAPAAPAPQQIPFSHLSPFAHVPCPAPEQALPSPAMGTHCPLVPLHAKPDAQSPLPAHAVRQVATGWSAALVHATGAYGAQSRDAPAQALSSSTVTVPQIPAWQVASVRDPWHVVLAPPSVQAGRERKDAGQSAATPQQFPAEQQKPLSQCPDWQALFPSGPQGWASALRVTSAGRELQAIAASTATPADVARTARRPAEGDRGERCETAGAPRRDVLVIVTLPRPPPRTVPGARGVAERNLRSGRGRSGPSAGSSGTRARRW